MSYINFSRIGVFKYFSRVIDMNEIDKARFVDDKFGFETDEYDESEESDDE